MSHIDTLKTYQSLILAGIPENEAKVQVQTLVEVEERFENRLISYLKELKGDFASQKMIAILGTLIIAIGGFTLNEMWNLSHDMVEVKARLTYIEDKINK